MGLRWSSVGEGGSRVWFERDTSRKRMVRSGHRVFGEASSLRMFWIGEWAWTLSSGGQVLVAQSAHSSSGHQLHSTKTPIHGPALVNISAQPFQSPNYLSSAPAAGYIHSLIQ